MGKPNNLSTLKKKLSNYIIFYVILFQQELLPVEFITKRMQETQSRCAVSSISVITS